MLVWILCLLFLLSNTVGATMAAQHWPRPLSRLYIWTKPMLSKKGQRGTSTRGRGHRLMRYDFSIVIFHVKHLLSLLYECCDCEEIYYWIFFFPHLCYSKWSTHWQKSSSILQVFHWLQLIPTSPHHASKHSTAAFYFGLRYLPVFSSFSCLKKKKVLWLRSLWRTLLHSQRDLTKL